MSLARLALVIGSAVSCWITFTAPAKSARVERPKASSNEQVMGLLIRWISVPKVICLVFAVFEAVATLSFYFPDRSVPVLVRSFRGSNPPDPSSAPFVTVSLFCMLGGVLRIICYRTLGNFFTFNLSIRKSHALVTSGPYSYVRHPSYAGAILSGNLAVFMHLLPDSWMQNSGFYAIPAVKALMWIWLLHILLLDATCFGRMADEDRLLKETFRKEWEDWAERVKYRLVPGVY